MRTAVLRTMIITVALAPIAAGAQVYRHETAPPAVTAANAPWQRAGEPIFHAGNFYYPAGAAVFFDGKVMVRTGLYEGVPLYADVTLEPYSIVYVPVGGARMQPYERRREGELAGTVGSRTPSFPIERDVEVSAARREGPSYLPRVSGLAPVRKARGRAAASATSLPGGDVAPDTFAPVGAVMIPPSNRALPPSQLNLGNGVLSTPQAEDGLWISYQGSRWYSAGRAVPLDVARFEQAGSFNDFPVYRERGDSANRIFVTTVRNGPVAPFERR
ncbi:MAG: hypothetical protein AB7H96_24670 [Vicinamibacterales bacterium]